MDPFVNSETLAQWAAERLRSRGLDELANWRMAEYWVQVELFRSIEAGQARPWRHLGWYEHPYHTDLPRSGSKTTTKWIDLVLAKPDVMKPESVVWVELKDLGRSHKTVLNNARGLGHDLAALWAMDPVKTKALWLNPLPHSLDRGRLEEWTRLGPGITCHDQLIAQIVLLHKPLTETISPKALEKRWLDSFVSRCKGEADGHRLQIACSETDEFLIFGLVEAKQNTG